MVLLLSAKSAEPPHISGRSAANFWITSPEALRVEISFSLENSGSAERQFFGNSLLAKRSDNSAAALLSLRQFSNLLFHSFLEALARSNTFLA